MICVSIKNMFIVTNYDFKFFENLSECNYIFFNPWGFSKNGIETQVTEAFHGFDVETSENIYFCLEKLFYGRRSDIAFKKICLTYPDCTVIKVELDQLIQLLDNSYKH